MEGYISIASSEGEGHCRLEEHPSLRDAEAIIFDLDGTLVDSRSSLEESLLVTSRILFAAVSGRLLPVDSIADAALELRKTGGFNNPWDSVYCIFLAQATSLSEKCILKAAESIRDEGTVVSLSELMKKSTAECRPDDVQSCLDEVIEYADQRGVESVVEGIDRLYGGKKKKDAIRELKEALRYPGAPSQSIIPALFDAFYLGSKRFREVHGADPPIDIRDGLISTEKMVLELSTAEYLKRRFPGGIGLATGRPRYAAENALDSSVWSMFTQGAFTFGEDVEEEEKKRLAAGGAKKWPGKPDPFSLLHALAALKSGRGVVYVGDSVEDLLMAKVMPGYGSKIHFVGVYRYSISPKEMEKIFLSQGASAVLPTVNQLQAIMS